MKDYKKILEGVVNIINTTEKSDIGFANICTYIGEKCPELAESEDEKIRKTLMQNLKERFGTKGNMGKGLDMPDVLAWLEKQGEPKPVPAWMPKFLDELRSKKNYFDWDENKDIEGQILAIIKWMNPNYFNGKEGEQNPAEEYNITGIGSKNAHGKLGEMIKKLKPVNEVLEQNPWSEEDERKSLEIKCLIANYRTGNDEYELCSWIDKLKDRVQPRPKQEWSEEDERIKNNLLSELTNLSVRKLIEKETEKKYASWLKSFRPQSTWKPSDEQMKALSNINVTGCISYAEQGKELINLYNDLKKLKE